MVSAENKTSEILSRFHRRRDRLVVRTLRCGRSNPGSNPGQGTFLPFLICFSSSFFYLFRVLFMTIESNTLSLIKVRRGKSLSTFYYFNLLEERDHLNHSRKVRDPDKQASYTALIKMTKIII